jgi:hypothetical protein
MDVIDSEGRLFGVVNIIDAFVVLVVVAVVAAGVALVLGGPDDTDTSDSGSNTVEVGTTHATLDFGTQSDAVADALDEGDSYSPGGQNTLTITDVYLAPREEGTHVLARVELRGTTTDTGTVSTSYDGAPPRLGRSLSVTTDRYGVSGTIRAVGGGPTLNSTTTRAVIRATVPSETARRLTAGTRTRVGGRVVATVRNVSVFEADSVDERRVVMLAELRTYWLGDRQYYGGTALARDASVTLPLGDGMVSGQIEQLGADATLGRETRDVLVTTTMSADDARNLAVGDTYTIAGRDIGTVETATVYGTDKPDQKRVYVGVALETLTVDGSSFFGRTRLHEGATVPFRTADYEFSGTVTRLGTTEQRGVERTRTVRLGTEDLSPTRADSIRAGMVERAGEETIARLVSVQREPSQVVVTTASGDVLLRDHPVNRDLTITANLTVRETASGVRFKGETIRPGSPVTLDLEGVTIKAEVLSL